MVIERLSPVKEELTIALGSKPPSAITSTLVLGNVVLYGKKCIGTCSHKPEGGVSLIVEARSKLVVRAINGYTLSNVPRKFSAAYVQKSVVQE